ncbi:MAG TPA: immunoglobulin domain-containing protein, partial [Chthoniobacteraceae bacterium]|nr:immunoglobulin domain-containing protein [Chthoniobacteraceae bacterium]
GEVGRSKFQIGSLSFLGSAGSGSAWLQLFADSLPALGRNHVNFQLSAEAEYLRLSNNDANRSEIDSISFGLQSAGATQGRIVDGQSVQIGLIPSPGEKNLMLPVITGQPLPATVAANSPASFGVTAVGSEPMTLQWRRNGSDVTNATSNQLQIQSATENDDGLYDLVATNSVGHATSLPARLVVQLTFDQWRANRFSPAELADPNSSGSTADFDRDGTSNVQEYFQNSNPKLTDNSVTGIQVGQEPTTGSPSFLTLTYRQSARATGLSIQHQASPSLAPGSWLNVMPSTTTNIGSDVLTGDPIMRARFPVNAGETTKYLRLQITP